MVSFQCDGCADTVKKPKLDQHRQKCWASFTCLDCSTTFRNQEYKSHTSCVSEAEKYQGALYKGPKKGKQPPPPIASVVPSAPAPAPAAAVSVPPSPSPAAASPSAIHPSRLAAFDAPAPSSSSAGGFRGGAPRGRGGYVARGGRGGAVGGGRGWGASGENSSGPKDGMRTWGSPVVSAAASEAGDSTPVPPAAVPAPSTSAAVVNGIANGAEEKKDKKEKKRKGDKGGTGSKANSNSSKPVDAQPAESSSTVTPAAPTPIPNGDSETSGKKEKKDKKRKRDSSLPEPTSTDAAATNGDALPEKTIKRLKKNLSKLDSSSSEVPLSAWLEKVGKGKKDALSGDEVLRGLKVGLVDGQWVLRV